jgi:hypothetical protein
MNLIAIVLLAQLATPMRQTAPVLSFPERGLDDSAAYRGYQTRLFRDAAGNTVQVYLDQRAGRIVHLLADAENESIGVTPSDETGRTVPIQWGGAGAAIGRAGRARVFEQPLVAEAPQLHLASFLLGSMRVERDFQYARQHDLPMAGSPFVLPEFARLVAALQQLPPAEQTRHLALLGAADLGVLRARLRPTLSSRQSTTNWTARIIQPSLDGLDTLLLEVRTDPRLVESVVEGESVVLRERSERRSCGLAPAGTAGAAPSLRSGRRGSCSPRIPFSLRIVTSGTPLTPLMRKEIFNQGFLDFLATTRRQAGAGGSAALRARWLERQVRGLELLASREKLMAGLPNYATYFGRDMLLTALMMRPIWRPEVSEFVVASALRKLSPRGDVSHEEAVGGQALREAASEYATLVDEWRRATGDRTRSDSLLARAYGVLRDRRRVRENYHMIDDEFQLPVVEARWLADPAVPPARKRRFLADSTDGSEPRLRRLLRELALVSRMTEPYAADPIATNLVSFPRLGTRCSSASWRDSDAGYAGGCFAMDVNTIWAPYALVATQRILATLGTLGLSMDSVARGIPELRGASPLGRYIGDPRSLQQAIDRWRGASRHFLVQLGPDEVRSRVLARLAAMPEQERRYWSGLPSTAMAERDSLAFPALSLDAEGRPIGVANTDPATRLFLDATDPAAGAATGSSAERARRDVRLFVRPYPVGLLIDRVGPAVANDAYAPPSVWPVFERDQYHGPKVVWGREVNLFLLGVSGMLAAHGGAADAPELRDALRRVMSAVEGAGFRSELWSYEVRDGRLMPVRYGTGSDVQLWSTSDLAVQFALWQLARAPAQHPTR